MPVITVYLFSLPMVHENFMTMVSSQTASPVASRFNLRAAQLCTPCVKGGVHTATNAHRRLHAPLRAPTALQRRYVVYTPTEQTGDEYAEIKRRVKMERAASGRRDGEGAPSGSAGDTTSTATAVLR